MAARRRRRRTRVFPVLILLILIVLAVWLMLRGRAAPGRAADAEATGAPTATPVPETPASTPTPTPWNLVLVNRDHPVPEDWTVEPVEISNGQSVDARIVQPLLEMFEAAREVNLNILPIVESGYRSAEKQQELFDARVSSYLQQGYSAAEARAEAEKWVSLPGTSEHQLGLAVDISGAVYAIYPWLQEQAEG